CKEASMNDFIDLSRRSVMTCSGLVIASAICAPAVWTRSVIAAEHKGPGKKLKEAVTGKDKEEVTPPEDLMREHGVLDRVLLIYETVQRRFAANENVDPAHITQSAEIIRDFINNYH